MAKTEQLLDESKPYVIVRGHAKARYLQGGHYYDVHKHQCGQVPTEFVPKKPAPAPKPPEKETARDKALKRAADKLGDLGKAGPPKTVADAYKENAAAAAAEENAG
jgi:hypothetical protein